MVEPRVPRGRVAGDYAARAGCEEGETDESGVHCDDSAVWVRWRVGVGSVLLLLGCLFGVALVRRSWRMVEVCKGVHCHVLIDIHFHIFMDIFKPFPNLHRYQQPLQTNRQMHNP